MRAGLWRVVRAVCGVHVLHLENEAHVGRGRVLVRVSE